MPDTSTVNSRVVPKKSVGTCTVNVPPSDTQSGETSMSTVGAEVDEPQSAVLPFVTVECQSVVRPAGSALLSS